MVYSYVYGVSDLAALKAEYPTNGTLVILLGPNFPVEDAEAIYVWNSTSTDTPDDSEYILPNFPAFTTTGRWQKIDPPAAIQMNADWAASSGVTAILNKPTTVSSFTNDAGYLNSAGLSGTLANYVTTVSLASILASYASASSVSTGLSGKLNIPTGTTAQYMRGDGSLASFPSISAAQVNADWNAGSGVAQVLNKPTLGRAVVGITEKTGSFRIYKNATVASGVATFHLTVDGTSTGAALFTEVYDDSVQLIVNDPLASYQIGWAFSNSNKTITATANKLTTANILTGLLGQAQANGATVKLIVEGR